MSIISHRDFDAYVNDVKAIPSANTNVINQKKISASTNYTLKNDYIDKNTEIYVFDKEIKESTVDTVSDYEELYSYDENGNASLKIIHPKLQEKKELLIQLCEQEGIYIKVTEDVRTVQRQNELYAKGRTTSGSIVTNAQGSDYKSYHQWGIAFDVCINIKGSAYDVDLLKRIGELGKSIGLEWGGDWTSIVDMPHFQLAGYDINELLEQYGDPAGFAKTWDFSVG